ncbi:MAG: phosphatase PAP2 family protein [Alphaproteobacteria bacterium]
MREAFREYRWLLLVASLYAATVSALALGICHAPFEEFEMTLYVSLMIAMKCMIFFVIMAGVVWACNVARHGLKEGKARYATLSHAYLDGPAFPRAVFATLVLTGIGFFFTAKSLIPRLNPYKSDPAIAELEKTLHLGHYPHEWVIPFTDSLHFSFALDTAYLVWFAVMYAALAYNVFIDSDINRRLRFLWTFALSWILLGTLLATGLSSTGPLFFGNFYPDMADPYKDLVAHFDDLAANGQNLSTARGREMLLAWTKGDRVININAISAMPSMHVAVAWMAALYARTIGKAIFAAALAFCVLILWGAVYFGYHYALDGYVSIVAVSLIWWGLGKAFPAAKSPDSKA